MRRKKSDEESKTCRGCRQNGLTWILKSEDTLLVGRTNAILILGGQAFVGDEMSNHHELVHFWELNKKSRWCIMPWSFYRSFSFPAPHYALPTASLLLEFKFPSLCVDLLLRCHSVDRESDTRRQANWSWRLAVCFGVVVYPSSR